MKKFKKEIVPLGDHVVSDKEGNRKKVTITEERAKKWVETFKRMQSQGLNVYAPWEHDFDNKPAEDVESLLNPKNNGGKWTDITLENGSLWGVIEAATEQDAEAIGTKVEGCSIFVDDYEDGKGQKWEDAILHICLTNKPVATTGNYTSIAMSTSVAKKSNPGIISSLIETLKSIGITLTPTDDVDELLKMLTVALDNSPLKEGIGGGIPANATPKAPRLDLVMSTDVKPKEADTSSVFVEENKTLQKENKKLQSTVEKFQAYFKSQAKKDLLAKVNTLAESFSDDDEDGKKLVKQLKSEVESTEFSFDENGEVIITPLHKEIDLHIQYRSRPKKEVEDNGDKVPDNVEAKEVEDEPNDDPRYIDPNKLMELVNSMPL